MLRDYQEKTEIDIRNEILKGHRKIIAQSPTGSGKTVVASEIIKKALEKGNSTIFLAHRRELIIQCQRKLFEAGVDAGLIMAGCSRSYTARVQVASVQTLDAIYRRRKSFDFLPPAKLVVIDECHRSLARTYRRIIDHYASTGSYVLGLTATPCRGDGKGLGHIYDSLVIGPTISSLQEQKYLVKTEYYVPYIPDLSKTTVRMGDYVEKELSRIMLQEQLVGDVVSEWLKIDGTRQTVVFASGVDHSRSLTKAFQDQGIRAEHIDGKTPHEERASILSDLDNGKIMVVCNAMVLTEGWDCPRVSHLVLARPTKSIGLYLQMAGRVLRPFDGKENCIIQDHSGCVLEHGRIEEYIPWSLDEAGKISEKIKPTKDKEAKIFVCKECSYAFSGSLSCPRCGHEIKVDPKWQPHIDGELVKLTRGGSELVTKPRPDETSMIEFARQLKWIQQETNRKEGWVFYQLRKKFKCEDVPFNIRNIASVEPDDTTARWVKSQQIRYIKGMQKAAKA